MAQVAPADKKSPELVDIAGHTEFGMMESKLEAARQHALGQSKQTPEIQVAAGLLASAPGATSAAPWEQTAKFAGYLCSLPARFQFGVQASHPQP